MGLPLGSTGIRPRPMGPPAIRTSGFPVWVRVALARSAALDRASVVSREVVLRTKGAPRGCCRAVGGNVLLPAASAAESIWPPRPRRRRPRNGVRVVGPYHCRGGQRASPRTAATTEEEPSLSVWKRARTLAPPSHLISAGCASRCSPPQAPPGASSGHRLSPLPYVISGQRDVVDSDPLPLLHFHFCWGTTSVILLSATLAARSTVSRCLSKSCRVEVGVVTPRIRRVSVHQILSTLTLLMPSLWRARVVVVCVFLYC